MILSIIVASLHCQDRRKIWKSRGPNSYVVGMIYPPDWNKVNVSVKIWKGDCPPTLRFLQPCKSVPLFYIPPHFLWLQVCLLLSNLSLVSRRFFFQFQFGFRTPGRTDNMIVSRIFIAAAIILPYVLSFPLENDLSVSVKYLEQLENRIHNLEEPGM